jgi:hypothetical protein
MKDSCYKKVSEMSSSELSKKKAEKSRVGMGSRFKNLKK